MRSTITRGFVFILLVLIGIGTCEISKADDMPGEVQIHPPMIESLENVAISYWAQRGVIVPSTPPEIFVIANEPEAIARGEEPGNRIWLTQEMLELRGSNGRVWQCIIYLHERGHNAGLVHNSGDSIMATDPPSRIIPPKCLKWANTGYLEAVGHR